MIVKVDLLQGTKVLQRRQVFHGMEVSSVSDLTFGKNVATRFREIRRAHQTHELNSCVPPMVPPTHVCAARRRQDRQRADRALTQAPELSAIALPLVEGGRKTF